MKWRIKKPSKKTVALFLALLVCAGGYGGYRYYTAAQQADTPQTVYKESAVERGDLTVGVTETGAATIDAVSVKSKVKAEVAEVLVKSGQSVKAGDPLMKLSLDSLQEEMDSLQVDYEKAKITMSEAEINKQLSELEAQTKLTTNKLSGETADKSYQLTLDQAEYTYLSTKSELSELASTLSDYRDELDDMDDTLSDYAAKADKAETEFRSQVIDYLVEQESGTEGAADEEASDEETLRTKYEAMSTEDLYSYWNRNYGGGANIASYYKKWQDAEDKYDSYNDNFEDKEEELEEKIASAKRSVASKRLSLQQSETSNELEKITAAAERDESLATGENADLLYTLELQSLENSLKSSQLSVQELEKQIAELEPYLSNGVITAPCDGLIMSLSCVAGDTVAEDGEVAALANSSAAYVLVSIDQEDIADVKIGNPANITFTAYDDLKYTGVIDSIEITPARSGSSTVTYSVSIKLDGDAAEIYEGMTGEVTFITKEVQDVLYVTNRTVLSQDGKEYVRVKRADGTIEQVEVQTGFSDGRNVEIKSGLSEGDVVLIESSLRQGV